MFSLSSTAIGNDGGVFFVLRFLIAFFLRLPKKTSADYCRLYRLLPNCGIENKWHTYLGNLYSDFRYNFGICRIGVFQTFLWRFWSFFWRFLVENLLPILPILPIIFALKNGIFGIKRHFFCLFLGYFHTFVNN